MPLVGAALADFVVLDHSFATFPYVRLVSWNVNGIRAVSKKGLFTPFVEKLQPDILCLQETKADQSQSDVEAPGYIEHWNSAEKKGYSGTAIFSKTEPLLVTPGLPLESSDRFGVIADAFGDPRSEGRVLTAEFPEFYVVTVYTPNAKNDLERLPLRHTQWDPAFLHYVKELEGSKPVIFCGDLNVAHTPDDLANRCQPGGTVRGRGQRIERTRPARAVPSTRNV
ncbi:MAG: exodeoxyribonuclease [Acidimicrobiaceae bacterium]|nr:exodeoxyribonuclease [Acidimicrobiaceae bacterium]